MSPIASPAFLLSLVLGLTGFLSWGEGVGVAGFSAPTPIQAGSKTPWADLHWGFPPNALNVPSYAANRKLIIVGLPGAFLSKGTQDVVPSYLDSENRQILQDELGVDEVLVYAVNDGAVMGAYAKKSKIQGSLVSMMGDPSGEFTKECGMQVVQADQKFGVIERSKHFAMYVVNNVVQYVAVGSEDGCDPDDATCAPAMMEAIRACQKALEGVLQLENTMA
jgi:2-Cys peroxiredoxin 5